VKLSKFIFYIMGFVNDGTFVMDREVSS
jgi:hypothetical protein